MIRGICSGNGAYPRDRDAQDRGCDCTARQLLAIGTERRAGRGGVTRDR